MNSTEQRQRHTAVRTVQTQINDLITVVAAMDEHTAAAFNMQIDRLFVATEPLRRGFWGRLRWLVTGR